MNIFKEIWTFVKLLFVNIDNVDKVEPLAMTHFPFKGYKYLMWCGKVIYRDSLPQNGVLVPTDENHETIHLMQAKDKGSWWKFYLSYFWEWIKHGMFFVDSSYYAIKYEIEAYAKQYDMDYLKRRDPNAVNKFVLKNAHKIFNSFGFSEYTRRNGFKNYIHKLFEDI